MRNESFYQQLSLSSSWKKGSFWLKIAMLAVCLMCLVSCVPLLMGKKASGTEGKTTDGGSGLIKPKMIDNPDETGVKSDKPRSQPSEKPDKLGSPTASEKVAEFDEKPPTGVTKTPESLPKPDSRAEKSPATRDPEKPVALVPAAKGKESGANPALTGKSKDESADPTTTDPSKLGDSFKKHDHAKYIEKIKNKAIDLVNKEPTCKLARLCRNTTTDEWGLTLYYLQEKSYVLVAYGWDKIDEKWEESLKADKQPISRWKHHLDFSAAGKQCDDLKGTRP